MGKMRMDWLAELRKVNRMGEVLLRTIEERGEPVDEKLAKEAWAKGTEFIAALFKLDQEIAKRHERNDAQTLRREVLGE